MGTTPFLVLFHPFTLFTRTCLLCPCTLPFPSYAPTRHIFFATETGISFVRVVNPHETAPLYPHVRRVFA